MSKNGRPLSRELSKTQMSTATSGGHHQNLLHRRHSKYESEYKRHIRLYDQEIENLKKTYSRLQVEKEYYQQDVHVDALNVNPPPQQATEPADEGRNATKTPSSAPVFPNDEFMTSVVQQARGRIRNIKRQETKDKIILNNLLTGLPEELQNPTPKEMNTATAHVVGTPSATPSGMTRRHSCFGKLSSAPLSHKPLERSSPSPNTSKSLKTLPEMSEDPTKTPLRLTRLTLAAGDEVVVERKLSDPAIKRDSVSAKKVAPTAQPMKKRGRSYSVV